MLGGEIVDACGGCRKIHEDGKHCTVYPNPAILMRWKTNPDIKVGCSMNHAALIEETKKRVGQQKGRRKKRG